MRAFKILGIIALSAMLGACTADVEDEGSLPDVDVQGGDLPNVDVDPADVDVSTDTQTIQVPDVDINSADEP